MKKLNTALASLVVITALGTPAFAQDQRPQPAPQTPAVPAPTQQAPTVDDSQRAPVDMKSEHAKTMATGRLVKVNTDDMTIVIKGADDQEQSFRYTDATKVIGAQEQVSGLSTKAGSLVTIHFTQGAGDTLIATKVHFDTKK